MKTKSWSSAGLMFWSSAGVLKPWSSAGCQSLSLGQGSRARVPPDTLQPKGVLKLTLPQNRFLKSWPGAGKSKSWFGAGVQTTVRFRSN